MPELILLFIALVCLSFSAETAVFFCGIAIAVLIYRRHVLTNDLDRLKHEYSDQAEALRREIRSARDAVSKVAEELAQIRSAVQEGASVAPPSPPKAAAELPHSVIAASVAPPPAPPKPVEIPKVEATTPRPAPVPTAVPRPSPSAAPPTAPTPVAPMPVAPPPPQRPASAVPVKPAPVPAPLTASVQAPRPPAFRTSPPAPSMAERLRKALDLEETLGTNWLTKIGIVLVVLGMALFGMYELSQLGPHGKVLLLSTLGAVMLGGGIYLDRGDRYRIIGRTAIGGGWALLFFTSYATHHVEAMRVIFSETPALLLMLVVAVAMALHTLRYRSQVVTGLAFLLAYSTVTLTHDTVYALTAGAALAVGIVIIAIKMQWFELEVFGILSSYLNHLFWLYKLLGVNGANHRPFPEFAASTTILAFYWLIYRFSYIARRIESALQENVSAVAALLNTILLLGVMKYQSVHPELAFYALLVLGAFELAFGQIASFRDRRKAFILLSIVGATLMIMAVPFRYTGENRAILWMIGAEAFLAAGILLRENVFRRIGNVTALLVALHILVLELEPLFRQKAASSSPLVHAGTLLVTAGLLFYLNTHPLRFRWPELYSGSFDQGTVMAQSYCGGFTMAIGLWAIVSPQWTAPAWAALMIVLAFATWRYKTVELYRQAIIVAVLVIVRAFLVNYPQLQNADNSPHFPRVLIITLVAGAMYLSSWPLGKAYAESWPRNLLTWFGTALFAYLIATDIQFRWMCVAWLGLGAILLIPARRWKLEHLCFQEHVLALLATAWAWINLTISADTLVHRIVPALIVAGGLYATSRVASLWTDARERVIAYGHTSLASLLIVSVCYVEFRATVLPVAWMSFALVLAFVARRFKAQELAFHAHVISVLAVVQTVTTVLPSEARFHGISERLLVATFVVLTLYVMTRLVPMGQPYRDRELHHAYTWVASTLAAALLWYELQPISVAVAWALFGLLLFEVGTVRNIRQLRFQGYVALFSSFGRIFVVNLAANANPGDWISPRLMTVVPVTMILFFVYGQIAFGEESESYGRLDITSLLAHAGTISVAAVLYFQVTPAWIALAWSVLVPLLLTASLLLEQEVFLQHAVVLSLAIFSRGMIHNLFGGTYFSDAGWKGRYIELGSAIAVMLLSLPLAFHLKQHFEENPKLGVIRNTLTKWSRRPEQVIFFVPIVLLTFMLALKMRSGMVTVAWGFEAVAVVLLALSVNERSFRLAGLGLLMLCVGKIMIVDAWRLAPRDRYITFIILGLALLGVSFLYTRYRETIRQLL